MTSTRRTFIKGSAASVLAAAGAARTAGAGQKRSGEQDRRSPAATRPAAARTSSPALEKRLAVGLIGCGNRGNTLLGRLEMIDDVRVAAIADPDAQRCAAGVKRTPGAKPADDLRRVLDDPSIDGVIIATPDHWHAPAALLALDAGKHVYVEKPCAHNLHEAALLRDAAAKARGKLVVQHGTQARSSRAFAQVMQQLRDGIIGKVMVAKAWNIQKREDIGHGTPSDPPPDFDYDMWVGPAQWMPFQENRHHYKWHWWFNYGCGGIGNDGIHHLDYARWGLGVDTPPTRVSALGGKYYFDDDQQFPDTQQVIFEYADGDQVGQKRMLVYEQRLWSVTYPFNVDSGAEFFGTDGEMFLSARGKIRVIGKRNRRINWKPTGSLKYDPKDHLENWFAAIRGDATLNADMRVAFNTTSLVHLGNIATRVGRTLTYDAAADRVVGDREANGLLKRRYRRQGHWAIPAGA